MFLMYSLQIFVKLVPFITAHNSNILSHIEVYSLYSHSFKLFSGHHPWPERRKSNTGSLYLCTTAARAISNASFLVATHTSTRWAFDNILTSTHASEAFSTTNKSHMHTEDIAWEGWKFVTRSLGLNDDTCVLQACTSPPKTCYIQPALTFYC